MTRSPEGREGIPSRILISQGEDAFSADTSISSRGITAYESIGKTPSLKELRLAGENLLNTYGVSNAECSEWIGDVIDYGKEPITSSDKHIMVMYTAKAKTLTYTNGEWVVEGGIRHRIYLPPSGWIIPSDEGLMFEQNTGMPLQTTNKLSVANYYAKEAHFSYFWRGDPGDGLTVLNRECERFIGPHFDLNATLSPSSSHPDIGLRQITRIGW